MEAVAHTITVRIAAIDTFVVSYPVVRTFKFFAAAGQKQPTRDTVVVRITDTDGRVGSASQSPFSGAPPWPSFHGWRSWDATAR